RMQARSTACVDALTHDIALVLMPFINRSELLFILLFRPHPSSTLFPYTTLFRSPRLTTWCGNMRSTGSLQTSRRDSASAPTSSTDRKSTRLNSSHVKNSYAVFCLKKTKNDAKSLWYNKVQFIIGYYALLNTLVNP